MGLYTIFFCLFVIYINVCVCDKKSKKKKTLIDPMRHDIFIITEKTFDTVVGQFLTSTVASVLYYKNTPESEKLIDDVYNNVAKELKGMVKITAIDCDEHTSFCEKQNIKEYPQLILYPLLPMPKITYKGEWLTKNIKKQLLDLIDTTHIKRLTKANLDILLSEDPGVPKATLISEKEVPSTIYKALANAFHDRITFTFATKNDDAVVSRFKPKKYPHLEIRTGDGKSHIYDGKLEYPLIHEWINVRSETFVRGGGFSDESTTEKAKPWLVQPIPEMTAESHHDICMKKEGWCAIYIPDTTELAEDKIDLLIKMKEYAKEQSTKSKFYWMWLDIKTNSEFKEVFQITSTPSFVILNPHKRLRFSTPEKNDVSEEGLKAFIEKILSGDGKFTVIKGGKLPQFKKSSLPQDEKKGEL